MIELEVLDAFYDRLTLTDAWDSSSQSEGAPFRDMEWRAELDSATTLLYDVTYLWGQTTSNQSICRRQSSS